MNNKLSPLIHTFKNKVLTYSILLTTLAIISPAAFADIGKMSGDRVSLPNLANRVTKGLEWGLLLIQWVGILLGATMFLTCLYNIAKISRREKEGSVFANAMGGLVGCLMMASLFWAFYGSALLTNSTK